MPLNDGDANEDARNPQEEGNASLPSTESAVDHGDSPNVNNNTVNRAKRDLLSTEPIAPIDDDLSVVEVARVMREQDADLLESMHYASSQVAHYSPGGTPIQRPADRSLPLDDLPMIPPAALSEAYGEMVMCSSKPNSSGNSGNSSNNVLESRHSSQQLDRSGASETRSDQTSSQSGVAGKIKKSRNSTEVASVRFSKEDDSSRLQDGNQPVNAESTTTNISSRPDLYRRCLSGDISSMPADQVPDDAEQVENEEEETTASPISVAQEAQSTMTTTTSELDSGRAQQRRVSEAIQFAEAVGEMLAVNRDKLCIIEDHTDDDDSDDELEPCDEKRIGLNESIDLIPSQIDDVSARKKKKDVPPELVDVRDVPNQIRRKARPSWPFGRAGTESLFLDRLSDGLDTTDFEYKGICANPPAITERGIQRGNYARLHRKAWLEVSDKYHRYGKNLRLYYRYWERLGFPTNQFFDWLDSKGEAAGQPLPNMEECPRSVLDADTVLYITNPEVTERYALNIVCNEEGKGQIIDVDGDPVQTGSEGWIFVLRDNAMYGAKKVTSLSGHSKQRFHHSSFFGGKAVASAGIIITDADGYVTRLYPHSGHYRPSEAHMQRMLFFLHRKGVALGTFEMDTQQFRHVARDKEVKHKEKDGGSGEKSGKSNDKKQGEKVEKKARKVDNLHLEKAVHVACFLNHKATFAGEGIFDRIHKIRRADVTSVTEALESVDDGGFWFKNKGRDQQPSPEQ